MRLLIQAIDQTDKPVFEFKTPTITIGQDSGCDLPIPGKPIVSRRHARITVTSDGAVLDDLGSTNGTFVNDRRVEGEVTIRKNDYIRLGHTGPYFQVLELDLTKVVQVPAGTPNKESNHFQDWLKDAQPPTYTPEQVKPKNKPKPVEEKANPLGDKPANPGQHGQTRRMVMSLQEKNRKLVIGAGIAVVAILIIGGATGIYFINESNRRENWARIDFEKQKRAQEELQKAQEALQKENDAKIAATNARVTKVDENLKKQAELETQLYDQLVRSAVWIHGTDGKKSWSGSGGVIHVGKRLIITNAHVVKTSKKVIVLFPERNADRKVITEKRYYEELIGKGKMERADVIFTDPVRDLAVIQLENHLPSDVTAIKISSRPARENQRLLSVGNPGPSNALWVPSTGIVRSRVPEIGVDVPIKDKEGKIIGADRVIIRAAWSLETTLPINGGDSGSPVVNDRGQLVAVNFGGLDQFQLMQFAVDRDEVINVLKKVGVREDEVMGVE